MHVRIRIPPVRPGLTYPPHPTSQPCLDLVSSLRTGVETLTRVLRERVFSKNTSLHASDLLSKPLTFAKEPGVKKPGEELTATAAEMERTALKAVINLVEVIQLVDLSKLLENRVVE